MVLQVDIIGETWNRRVLWYEVQAVSKGARWYAYKRYSDFVSLEEKLGLRFQLSRLPLPGKGCLGLRHRLSIAGFNVQRREALNAYLQAIAAQVEDVSDCLPLAEFLAPPELPPAAVADACSTSASSRDEPAVSDLRPLVFKAVPSEGKSEMSATSSRSTPTETCVGTPRAGGATPKRQAPLPNFQSHFAASAPCSGSEWEELDKSKPELAALLRRCGMLSENLPRFQNDSEEVFQAVRRWVVGARSRGAEEAEGSDLDRMPEQGMGFVWDFVVLIAARKPFYRNQAIEVANKLKARQPWEKVLATQPELLQLADEFLS